MKMNHGRRKKISVIGAGNVGATVAQLCAYKNLADIVMLDIIDGFAAGKALDLMESAPITRFDVRVSGTTDFKDTADSDLVVITSGLPRKPGMSREDLRDTNAEIIRNVASEVIKYSPETFLIVVTNPLDTMTWVAKKYTGLPKNRIVGMAGVLDSTRFRSFIAMELGVSIEEVSAMVLGLHGPHMVPLHRYTSVSGLPVRSLLSIEKINELAERTRQGGTEIVNLLKKGSAFYAPGAAITSMAEAVIRDAKKILPAAGWLEGEYGLKDIFMGVPIMLGANGVEKIIELDLEEEELQSLKHSADLIKESVSQLKV